MNTHPTHTKCVGRMGATAIDSPHRCRCVFCCCVRCSLHTLANGWVFWVIVFFMHFWEHWCVGGMCFFPLRGILSNQKSAHTTHTTRTMRTMRLRCLSSHAFYNIVDHVVRRVNAPRAPPNQCEPWRE